MLCTGKAMSSVLNRIAPTAFDNLDNPVITICDNTCKAQLSANLVVGHEMAFGIWRSTKT